MITKEFAVNFAMEWVAAWNAHDLSQILSHYSDDFEMTSPFIMKLTDDTEGKLQGKFTISDYWKKALDKIPDLHFELIDVFFSMNSICIYYKSVRGLSAVEWLYFDHKGKVSKAIAHYDKSIS